MHGGNKSRSAGVLKRYKKSCIFVQMNDMASRSATPELNVNFSQDDPLERLKDLLRTLFQFDMPELDFGIYRIMNYRRREIEEFIEKHLIQAVEKEFQEYRKASVKELEEKVEEAKKKVMLDLGEDALRNGDVREDVKSFPVAKKYLELKKQLEDAQATESIKNQVFNDLYNFFSRYYEDGDFISKRRYSFKQERYAIPYNGEEVKFYWATADQYYVKTMNSSRTMSLRQKAGELSLGWWSLSLRRETRKRKGGISSWRVRGRLNWTASRRYVSSASNTGS